MAKKNVLVYSEDRELALQLLGKGRQFADMLGGSLISLLMGSEVIDINGLIAHGADKVYVVEDPKLEHLSLEPCRATILKAFERSTPHVILIGATKRGKELAARVAAALNTGCMTECVRLDLDGEKRLIADRLTYGGSTISTQISKKGPHIATVATRVFVKMEPSSREGEVIGLDIDLPDSKVKIIERRKKGTGSFGLEEASIIVSAGRGFKEQEDLQLLNELAELLGATVGCSRPVAADLGWMEDWIGISGRKVSPKLYLACGISGTIQHAAGIRNSQIIVAINISEDANIHEMSDYSIVGDLYIVIPALTKALKDKIG